MRSPGLWRPYRMSAFGGGLKWSMQHLYLNTKDGVFADEPGERSRF